MIFSRMTIFRAKVTKYFVCGDLRIDQGQVEAPAKKKKKGKKKIEALAVRTGMDDPEKRSEDMLMGGAVSCRHGREHSEIAGSGGVGVRVASLRSNALWTTKHRRA